MELARPGWRGKSRRSWPTEFVDGVWVFELAANCAWYCVGAGCAAAAVLEVAPRRPGESVGESVASALKADTRLLVFDNCEHVVDSVADLVEAILAASATVKVLATHGRGNRCR